MAIGHNRVKDVSSSADGRLFENGSGHPKLRCTVLPSCGHWPQLEKPDTYNALVLQFLEEVAA